MPPLESRSVQGAKQVAQVALRYVRGLRSHVIAIAGLSLLSGIAEAGLLVLIIRLASQLATDSLTLGSIGPIHIEKLNGNGALMVGVALLLVSVVCNTIIAILAARLQARAVVETRGRLTRGYVGADWPTQNHHQTGAFRELLTNYAGYIDIAVGQTTNVAGASLQFIAYVGIAVLSEPIAALAAGVGAAMLYLALQPLSRATRRAATRSRDAFLKYFSWAGELVGLTRELRTFGTGSRAELEAQRLLHVAARRARRERFLGAIAPSYYQSSALLMILVGLAILRVTAVADPAAVGAIVVLLVRSLSFSQRITTGIQQLNAAGAYVDMIEQAAYDLEAHTRRFGSEQLGVVGTVKWSDVSFGYDPGTEVLRHVSFEVKAGEVIGVVGPSGSGKSTMVQILLRLLEPQSGQYLVNGLPAGSYDEVTWTRAFALLPQDNRLLSGSIDANVRLLRDLEQVAVDEAVESAVLSQLRVELGSAAGGDVISLRGRDVSGGQLQRIGLARALAGRPSVLVLDEPTSALDLRTEDAIHRSLDALRGSVTMFIVAHRLSTIDSCDRVMVLEAGRISGFGQLKEMRQVNKFLREAYALAKLPD